MQLSDVRKKESKIPRLSEVAAYMEIPHMKLYRLVKDGKIKATNIAATGKKPIYGIKPADLQAYYDSLPDSADGLETVHK